LAAGLLWTTARRCPDAVVEKKGVQGMELGYFFKLMLKPRRAPLDRHALLAPSLTNAFEMLCVSAAVYDADLWYPIHSEPGVATFEVEHGVELTRDAYNKAHIAQARRDQEPVLGQHAGFNDFFVPIATSAKSCPVLVTGPFAAKWPTAEEIVERWRSMTGRQAHPGDPEFSDYLATTLCTLVLDDDRVATFGRWLSRVAALMAGKGRADVLFKQAEPMRDRLEEARFIDRMWEMARSMVDERTTRSWSSPYLKLGLEHVGLPRVPDQALVALAVSRKLEAEPVAELLRRYAFQRACADLARRTQNLISGRIGDYGVMFLSTVAPGQRRKNWSQDTADKAHAVARRFDLELHFGASSLPNSAPLSEHYAAALGAAESALTRGARTRSSSPRPERPGFVLGELRRELARIVAEKPRLLPTHFERYLETVAIRCGFRFEPARVHLEAGFERVTEALTGSGALQERSLAELGSELNRHAREARTLVELFAAYRRAVSEISAAVEQPVHANQDRTLRRALAYIHRNCAGPLSLSRVSREAGFAPNYFSRLFKKSQRMTFESYVQQVRIQRAKQMLAQRTHDVQRIGSLCGFSSASYFGQVFKRSTGVTPLEYRRRKALK
jgi:AraC-like DNA-binding protein